MKKILLAAALVFTFHLSPFTSAQSDPVVVEVGGQQIRQSEFMKEFLPTVNRQMTGDKQMTAAEKRQAVREYADLFAKFRAKVMDACARGFDTTRALRAELAKYRAELAAPYLIDSTVLSSLLTEAYERNHYSLRAQQILVSLRPDASPEDTLAALERIKELRDRVMKGEDFLAVSVEEFRRQNPKVQLRGNEGELGYFTAFDMVYPFENAAYGLKIGEISQPVRTRYGYHIVKLVDRVDMQGKLQLAHIWLQSADSSNQRDAIYDIYNRIMRGNSFEDMAYKSHDRSTAEKGGMIPMASLSQLPEEYVKRAEKMNVGDVSKPFFTKYGWHIIKLVHKDTLPPFESMVPYYKQKMTVDPRGAESRRVFAANARQRYGIVDLTVTPVPTEPKPVGKKGKKVAVEPVVMQASLDNIISQVPDSVFSARWRFSDTMFHGRAPMVRVPGHEYNEMDVARFIRRHQKEERPMDMSYYVRQKYDEFLDSVTVVYADSQLEKENPEFAALVEEYRRGLMIFNYNDKMIWSKAISDSAGFAAFYAQESSRKSLANPEDSIYFWRTRARVVTLDVADSAQLAPAKAAKLLAKAQKKEKGSVEMKQMLESAFDRKVSATPVAMELDLVEQGHQQLLADDQWNRGVYLMPRGKGYRALVVETVLPPMLKAQIEARGYYLNSYQNELEQKLNEELRAKYNVKIHWDVVDKISY